MIIADQPSKLSLPQINPGVSTVLEYLIIKFPYIDAPVWKKRIAEGKVHYHDGSPITKSSPFKSQQRIYYYREVESEPVIPFEEHIIFQDEQILVAYKPHFLPVVPGGKYINECLQNRLRKKTGIKSLQAVHRLDRVTAGLVIFSVNPNTRHRYHDLFKTQKIDKTYQAIALINDKNIQVGQQWEVKNRIVTSSPKFRMCISDGVANSHSIIKCVQQSADKALFELKPITGKTHQLRLHMQSLDWPILNDKYYPNLQALSLDDYSSPLQLLAKKIEFIDPITQQARHFTHDRNLSLDV